MGCMAWFAQKYDLAQSGQTQACLCQKPKSLLLHAGQWPFCNIAATEQGIGLYTNNIFKRLVNRWILSDGK